MSNGSQNTTITFYDNFVPSLKALEYTITVKQTLTVNKDQTGQDGGQTDIPPSLQAENKDQTGRSQKFLVRGPRFVIDPADVHRMFPPSKGVGSYHEYLPMIVFNKRALPWERGLNGLNFKPPIKNTDGYPWLALLLFTDDQLLIPGGAAPPPAGSQQNPTRTASFPLTQIIQGQTPGPPADTLGPTLSLEDDEDPAKINCNVIEFKAAHFTALLPSLNDLPWLAHVRQVSTEDKTPQAMKHDGWFSVVLCNRFAVPPPQGSILPPPQGSTVPPPQGSTAPQRNIAHLVSLEGFEQYLGADAPVIPSGYQKVRMISLCSWAFDCLADPLVNFSKLMNDLLTQPSGQATNWLLRLPLPAVTAEPTSSAETTAATRLKNGYVPLSYAAQTGEQTFAWYRGPLAPVVAPEFLAEPDPSAPDNPLVPLTASAAMIYDPQTGLFDQSYAVAFQTGRSLALHSLPFATSLLQWRRQAYGLIDLLLEYMHSPLLQTKLQADGLLDANGKLTGAGTSDLAQLLNADLLSKAFTDYLATEFADKLAQRIGAKGGFTPSDQTVQPSNPPTRQPVVPADLSDLMQNPDVVALLQQLSGLATGSPPEFQPGQLPKLIIEWLAQTALLYGVPFDNLVPGAQMLPPESIRFFYLDSNWIDALLDGALSVGIQSSRDSLFHQLMRDALHRAVDGVLHQVRDRLRKVSSNGTPPPAGQPAGFLLRSAVVAGWPGLEVRAYSASDQVNPMKPLRLDQVSPNVLFGLYPDVPVRLEFNEPSEGLVFGIEDEGIDLRYLPGSQGETAANAGQMIEPKITLATTDIPHRTKSDPASALIIGGDNGLAVKLQKLFPGAQPTIGPAALAVELVRVPEQLLFETQPQTGGTH